MLANMNICGSHVEIYEPLLHRKISLFNGKRLGDANREKGGALTGMMAAW